MLRCNGYGARATWSLPGAEVRKSSVLTRCRVERPPQDLANKLLVNLRRLDGMPMVTTKESLKRNMKSYVTLIVHPKVTGNQWYMTNKVVKFSKGLLV